MPSAGMTDASGRYYTWHYSILPYIKSHQVYKSPQYAFRWDDKEWRSSWAWDLLEKVGAVNGPGGYTWEVSYGMNNTDDGAWGGCGGPSSPSGSARSRHRRNAGGVAEGLSGYRLGLGCRVGWSSSCYETAGWKWSRVGADPRRRGAPPTRSPPQARFEGRQP